MMFVAGLATAGITHQVGWLLTSKEPWLDSHGGVYSAARRSQSTNNLKQMGIALYSYAEANETFPPGGTFDVQRSRIGGIRVVARIPRPAEGQLP